VTDSYPGVQTYRGAVPPQDLGLTLIHEHVFVRDPELERNLPGLEWSPSEAVERAVAGLLALHQLGVRTVVDLTVVGLGRDVALVQRVAERAPVNLVASTGFYVSQALPLYFRARGPGRLVDGPDPLVELMVRDIEEGIADTPVRAGMIKVMSAEAGLTDDVGRVMEAAAVAHRQTGVPITTHSVPALRNGLEQLTLLARHGVSPTRIIVGHSGDTDDLDYLRAVMDEGSIVGLDRFGMEHVLSDERRIDALMALVELGYADRMVLSHDAAWYSHVTPPSWRAAHAPRWHMEHLVRDILPALRARGIPPRDLETMLVANPRRLLTPALV
jgi:phosphotriesterase-related protein